MILKDAPYRSPKWLQAVREIDCCVRCGRYGVQAAHRNEGKSMRSKGSDCLCAAICPECHYEIDHGKNMSRDERRAEIDRAIVLTVELLAKAGKVTVK